MSALNILSAECKYILSAFNLYVLQVNKHSLYEMKWNEIKNQKLLKDDEFIQFEQVLMWSLSILNNPKAETLYKGYFNLFSIQNIGISIVIFWLKLEKGILFFSLIISHGAFQNWLFMNSRFSFETPRGFTSNAEVERTWLRISFFIFIYINPLFLSSSLRTLALVLLVRRGL